MVRGWVALAWLVSPAWAYVGGVPRPVGARRRQEAWRRQPVLGGSSLSAVAPGVEQLFDPAQFAPVCSASDTLYRAAQQSVYVVAGSDVYQEYAPLIAGALLRVRLELCVVESFVTEAIVPFVKEKGLSWVLPRTETAETFLAGTVFAVAVNVIAVGSTKIVSVLIIFVDLIVGLPARLLAKLPIGKQDDGEANSALQTLGLFGNFLDVVRKVAEFADLFVARYLALITVLYIAFKFVHFRFL
eukprot:CAMPEP_0197418978 /NCGR_PEP_ID=MMETSP1170-20131217/4515_1 /TAXON_ID=54406 /ORGANISM="Sarcinochrysis sp, Strain CCMP770" /LENGTH=242 /DNA_ID=CAMNT_0042946055 /DNA_START=13 /DNA_END=741 /DNA_ORIENTATION=-